jgi:hypothetical protein
MSCRGLHREWSGIRFNLLEVRVIPNQTASFDNSTLSLEILVPILRISYSAFLGLQTTWIKRLIYYTFGTVGLVPVGHKT